MPDETPPESLQSTSLLRGKTHLFRRLSNRYPASIHFPLAREDSWFCLFWFADNASIHFPLAREDRTVVPFIPVWSCFNPLPSCEGRRKSYCFIPIIAFASIHFPLAREDCSVSEFRKPITVLQSTSLLRGKTYWVCKDCGHKFASIHFPLAREDELPEKEIIEVQASIHFLLAR